MAAKANANKFALELAKEAKDLSQVDFRNFRDLVVLSGLNSVVELSPVARGTFRQNWHVTGKAPDDAMDDTAGGGSHGDPPSVAQILGANSELALTGPYDSCFIENNMPYAEPLENGHSSQAPGGMVRITVARLQEMRKVA